ncbi:ChbG/HpnK family deacetylase [Edaphobacter albus]|uniref:ChbG/HpnK family deacetylase n=1 Tax=Edaphobacter sp. 4G125 TaxID=2763071 RepID=UPI0016496AB4|nr:ChbG/HpnK family deacetylase [Edaphobacter sp. 4G125]QNI35957.1 ChbG/HpnK family deacetylase [Edaphobacter sp. 4G125]
MSSRLIINADDFGLTHGINRSIAELHQAGVLTSATLMATGPAFDDAVAIAQDTPSLGVGCHVVLTDGVPACSPEKIPSLLGPDGRTFRPSLLDFVQALLRGHIREPDIEREAEAQIHKLQDAGIMITHVDTHKHSHLFPAVTRPLLRVLERAGIRAIRNPFEPEFTRRLAHAGFKRRFQISLLNRFRPAFLNHPEVKEHKVFTTDGTLGVSATGNLNASTLSEILDTMPSTGIFELVCHPGYNDHDLDRVTTRLRAHREIEMQALLSALPRALAQPNRLALIHYGELATKTPTSVVTRSQTVQ